MGEYLGPLWEHEKKDEGIRLAVENPDSLYDLLIGFIDTAASQPASATEELLHEHLTYSDINIMRFGKIGSTDWFRDDKLRDEIISGLIFFLESGYNHEQGDWLRMYSKLWFTNTDVSLALAQRAPLLARYMTNHGFIAGPEETEGGATVAIQLPETNRAIMRLGFRSVDEAMEAGADKWSFPILGNHPIRLEFEFDDGKAYIEKDRFDRHMAAFQHVFAHIYDGIYYVVDAVPLSYVVRI